MDASRELEVPFSRFSRASGIQGNTRSETSKKIVIILNTDSYSL